MLRLRARFCSGEGYSVVTFFQSHSSSSATSCARPVNVPCPISERAIRITTSSLGLMKTQAPTSPPSAASGVCAIAARPENAIAQTPLAADGGDQETATRDVNPIVLEDH